MAEKLKGYNGYIKKKIMKKMIIAATMALSLAACNGAGDRTHDMPTITDSVSNQTPNAPLQQSGDTTPTTNDNAYNTDSNAATGANGRDTAKKNQLRNQKQ
jgi:hypothetical protein